MDTKLHELQKTCFHDINPKCQLQKKHFHNLNTRHHELEKTLPQHEHQTSWTTENTSTTWTPNIMTYRRHFHNMNTKHHNYSKHFHNMNTKVMNYRKHTSTMWTPNFNHKKHNSALWVPDVTTENTLLQCECQTSSAIETHFHSMNTKLCPLHCCVPMKGVVPLQFVCKLTMTTWHLEQ